MSKVEASTEVAASPEKIWAFLCDANRYPEWVVPTDRMLEVPNEAMGVGYVYKEHGGVPPFKADSEWRVTVFEPQRRQVHVGDDGSMTLTLTIDIAPRETGSRLTNVIELRPRWFLVPVNAVLWPLFMRRRCQAAMDESVANAKRVLEASPG